MAFSIVPSPGVSPVPVELGTLRGVVVDLNITSYTNPGGETLVPANLGMSRILGVTAIAGQRGFVYSFIRATNKLLVSQDATPAAAAALPEIANGNNHGTVGLLVVGV